MSRTKKRAKGTVAITRKTVLVVTLGNPQSVSQCFKAIMRADYVNLWENCQNQSNHNYCIYENEELRSKRVKLQASCQMCNCMHFVLLPPGVTPGAPTAILMGSINIPYQIRPTLSTYMNSNH